MAIPYVKQTWVDNNVANPTSAARLTVIENGVFDAHYQPAVRVTHNAAQSATSGTPLVLAFNTERFDTASNAADTMHDTVTNNSRLTCRYAGKYQITANVEFAANAAGYRQLNLRLNGATAIALVNMLPISGAVVQVLNVTTLYDLAVNDYVEVTATQTSGGALNVDSSGNYTPEFMMVRVG